MQLSPTRTFIKKQFGTRHFSLFIIITIIIFTIIARVYYPLAYKDKK